MNLSAKRRSVYYQMNNGNNSSLTSNGSMSSSPSTPLTLNTNQTNRKSQQLGTSPLDSPRSSISSATNLKQTSHNFQQPHLHTLCNKNHHDARRWSFTSIQSSSGYGSNTPPISNSSKQSVVNAPASSSTAIGVTTSVPMATKPIEYDSTQSSQYSSHEKLLQQVIKPSPTCNELLQVNERRSRLCSSNDSSNLEDSDGGYLSPSYNNGKRQRARSLSCSPSKLHNESDIIQIQNEKFKEKFPKACKQMEENLQNFITKENNNLNSMNTNIDAAARFILIQIIELAKSCLDKSKLSQLTCAYFDELTNSIEKLLNESRDKCELNSIQILHNVVKSFLLIIARVARLLECIEFDPLEFCFWLNAVEVHAKNLVKTDIPKYIISKLGLNRDSLMDDFNPLDTTDIQISDSTEVTCQKEERQQPCEENFEELKLISNGAYGAVYLVREKQTNERYAMKKIRKHNLILRNQVQQVFTERDIMTFTDNPFVVALTCTFETKKYLCMVMEYVEGGDVATLIKNMGPLPLDMARTYFAETTLAVEYLHSYGIIHRDLKPDNLLITSLGHIKLTDFGLSKVGLMNLTTNFYEGHYTRKDQYCKEFNDKQVCGTPQYLAPEVILRQGYGKTVDMWSMGIILYEFLTSVTPFNGNTPEELFANVINGEILWPETDDELVFIPDDAKNLIKCLLKHDSSERLGAGGTAEIKEHQFFHSLDWDNLLRIKADFIPQLDGPDDTSYFDTRSERYNHNTNSNDSKKESSGGQMLKTNRSKSNDDELDDDTDNELFASFSSCSSKFKHHSSTSNITCTSAVRSSPASTVANHAEPLANTTPSKAETNAADKLSIFIRPSTPPPLPNKQCESDDQQLLANLDLLTSLSLNDDNRSEPVESPTKVNKCTMQETAQTSAQPIEKPTNENNKTVKAVAASKSNRLPLRQTRSHLSSSSFCIRKPADTNQSRFPNSQSYSKLSLLSLPGDDFNTKQHNNNPNNNRFSFKSTTNNKSQIIEPQPIRDLLVLAKSKPAICIKRGPRGFGFTLQAVRVYYGDSNVYTIQHLVVQVDENGPARGAGLMPQDLITHVNDKVVCGMLHHEILKCIMSNTSDLRLHTVPLSKTNIKTGGRKRSPSKSKLSRPMGNSYSTNHPSPYANTMQQKSTTPNQTTMRLSKHTGNNTIGSSSQLDCIQAPHKKKTTLFRKLSERRAQRYEYMQQQQQQQGSANFSSLQNQNSYEQNNYQQLSRWNTSVGDLRAATCNSANIVHQSNKPIEHTSFDSSSSSSPVSSVPNSPSIHQNARPRSLIMFNTNNAYLLGHMVHQQLDNTQQGLAIHQSPSSLSPSPLHLQSQLQYQQMQPNQQQQQQQHQHRIQYPFLNCNSMILSQNQFFNSTNMSPSSSTAMVNCQNQSQPTLIHLNPSPLAISDGLPLTYGNPNTTQTFTPAAPMPQHQHHQQSYMYQQMQAPKLVMSTPWQNQLSPTLNLIPLTQFQHAQLQKSHTYFNYPVSYAHQVQQHQPQIETNLSQQKIQQPD